ncbi:MAG: ATPase [Oscillospiraceae bacterium]|nr:ATPase [Oscillospiraceae bacterium]
MDSIMMKQAVEQGKTYLGIELGSTRIKAMLIDGGHRVVAAGGYDWENSLVDGIWTYDMKQVWEGLQACYRELAGQVEQLYGTELKTIGAIGISAMMHGYLPFDSEGRQLAAFRTWRNTNTGLAAGELSGLFDFNIPHRWSVSHFYQSILEGQEHVEKVAFLTTLAGYVHWKLTGRKVLGVGDASGMFPIDSETNDFDSVMLEKFDKAAAEKANVKPLKELLPKVLSAGEDAGWLTVEGAMLLDPTGTLGEGVPMCPPEGDAGTGMTATNSVLKRTGNVSAGTSIFAMVVLDRPLSRPYPQIDMVTTPDGKPVAMVHCNNCSSDIDAWAEIFREFASEAGLDMSRKQVLDMLFFKALEGEADCGGLISYNFFSGEPIAEIEEGRPMFIRYPDSRFTLANFMRAHLQSALATLKTGLDILRSEDVIIERMYGHGGYFKAKGVGQRLMSAAIEAPVYVMETAGEGGAWGAALLAAYMVKKLPGQSLGDYLSKTVFALSEGEPVCASPEDSAGFDRFIAEFVRALPVQRKAAELMKGGKQDA